MKVKRWLSLGCVLLSLCMLLTGCSSVAPLPEGMDEQTVLSAGQQVLDELLAGEYDLVLARFREDIRNQEGKEITTDVIKELVDSYIIFDDLGEFEKVEDSLAQGVTEAGVEPQGVAVFHCKYEAEKVAFGFAFDLDMNLIGLSIARD